MQIFIDTANIDQIQKAADLGIITGVTTNPSLLSKEATADYETVTRNICSIIDGPVSVEVLAEDADAMIEEARIKASWAPNVNIKIPVTADGLRATSVLTQENIEVNMTLCFSANQALLAALAGATYVSVFVGRLDDVGQDGMQVVQDVIEILSNYPELDTQVIAASIRVTFIWY
jgi:transaldolase